MFSFNRRYFIVAVMFFIVLVFIAAFVRDRFFRPYFGDYLVVIFLYSLAKSFLKMSPITITVGVLLFSYLIELLQYFQFLQILGLEDVAIARVVLGNGFEWWDIVAYTLGAATVLTVELVVRKKTGVH
jgi:DNA integrity scanning protein DisA with diadenylate cyclase activity